jgi:hypothetical protein
MKLLLTSAGITTQSIADALIELVGKPASEIKVGFVPTAANAEEGNKIDWYLPQITNLTKYGIAWADIGHISSGCRLAKTSWRSRCRPHERR